MAGRTIDTHLYQGITLGSSGYSSPLTVTNTGSITPVYNIQGIPDRNNYSGLAFAGIFSSLSSGYILNEGFVEGNNYLRIGGFVLPSGPGVSITGATSLTNSGAIIGGYGPQSYGYHNGGTSADAVITTGSVDNLKTGIIIGGSGPGTEFGISGGDGIYLEHASLVNQGTILGGGNGSPVGGYFSGKGGDGVYGTGNITNNGIIGGGTATYATHFGQSPNADGGTGVVVFKNSTVTNSGTIFGGAVNTVGSPPVSNVASGGIGVVLDAGGDVLFNSGTIIGGNNIYNLGGDGVSFAYGGTIVDSGIIHGGESTIGPADAINFNTATLSAAELRNALGSRLIIEPGAAFRGDVIANSTVDNVLELGAGSNSGAGSLDMGGSFSGFGTITFDSGADWSLTGNEAELANHQTISGFTLGDELFLQSFSATSHTYVSGIGLELYNGTVYETLNITGDFTTDSFTVTDVSDHETRIVICYLRGTQILTPSGETPIEALEIGDEVVTKFGGRQRIKWIGRQSFSNRFVAKNRDRMPVCISAGALGKNLPKRDLFVSPGHSMLIGRALVLARNLVNGVTITQRYTPKEIHYYQLEFETHDCIQAEGAWSESYADSQGMRGMFHNASGFAALYPGYTSPKEPRLCAPRPLSGPALAKALRGVVARAAAETLPGQLEGWIETLDEYSVSGWAHDIDNPQLPVALEIRLGDRVIAVAMACDYRGDLAEKNIGDGRCHFVAGFRHRLSPQDLRILKIRRIQDGAELPRTPPCLSRQAA